MPAIIDELAGRFDGEIVLPADAAYDEAPDERLTYSNGVRKALYRDPTATNWDSSAHRSTPVHSARRPRVGPRR